ncbi:hypothetical protein ABZ388_15505 [Micromonospora parva]|uniref:Uncharacterized protein n=1 Tax=Micromonospora parva TaxID=1464048 RepID=A0ABW6VLT2_9ACTN|nr:hypothetical protein [Micromonospora sp. M51]
MSRATAYRYVAEAVRVLAAQTPTLHDALRRDAADGWSHVILDGKLFDTDRLAETTVSVKGDTIDARYSGVTAGAELRIEMTSSINDLSSNKPGLHVASSCNVTWQPDQDPEGHAA